MLDFRRLDCHHDGGRAVVRLVAPVVFPEDAKRLRNRLEQALRGDLDGMLDSLRVSACDPCRLERPSCEESSVVFCSLMSAAHRAGSEFYGICATGNTKLRIVAHTPRT